MVLSRDSRSPIYKFTNGSGIKIDYMDYDSYIIKGIIKDISEDEFERIIGVSKE